MSEHREMWFRRKRRGYGAEPATWKGWAAVAVFFLVEGLAAIGMFVPAALSEGGVGLGHVLGYVALTSAITAGFLWLVWTRTEGGWGPGRGRP